MSRNYIITIRIARFAKPDLYWSYLEMVHDFIHVKELISIRTTKNYTTFLLQDQQQTESGSKFINEDK